MPTKDAKYCSGNVVDFSPADGVVPVFHCLLSVFIRLLSHSVPRHTAFFWCVHAAFNTMTCSYHSKMQASISASFLLSNLDVIPKRYIKLSLEMQRCSWFSPTQVSNTSAAARSWEAMLRGNHQGKTIGCVRLCASRKAASQIQYFTTNRQREKT